MNDKVLFMTEEQIRRYKVKKTFANIGIYTFLIAIALFIIIPFYWMLATSLRSMEELTSIRIGFFPKKLIWSNYPQALKFALDRGYNFLLFYFNTIFVGALTTLGTLLTTVLAAFAFARLRFKGKEVLFSIFLATMMIPGEIFVISNYTTISALGWKNTYQALVLPFMTSVFYIFFLRQTFMQIPNELYLAAKVDGTGDFKYLLRVMIPMAKATLTTILILSMMGTWNAYVWPNLVADAENMQLVSNGLMDAFKSPDGTQVLTHYQMAAATLVTVPLLIVFLLLKKYIMRGVSRSGIKG